MRVIVPGWYAVASVKWLTEIELAEQPFEGYFQTERYHIDGEPLTLQAVRSLIIEPRDGEPVEPGEVVIRGVAWSGAAPIARVDVGVGDAAGQPATLVGERRRHGWQWWELSTRIDRPGEVRLWARATDLAGRTQPDEPQWNALGYANNAVQAVHLAVGRA